MFAMPALSDLLTSLAVLRFHPKAEANVGRRKTKTQEANTDLSRTALHATLCRMRRQDEQKRRKQDKKKREESKKEGERRRETEREREGTGWELLLHLKMPRKNAQLVVTISAISAARSKSEMKRGTYEHRAMSTITAVEATLQNHHNEGRARAGGGKRMLFAIP